MRHLAAILIIGSFFIGCNRVKTTGDNKTKNQLEQESVLVLKKLIKAMNEHNLDAMIDCVDPGYTSEQPFILIAILKAVNKCERTGPRF